MGAKQSKRSVDISGKEAEGAAVSAAPAPAVVASPEPERHEPKAETQPEQLPVNGLSLEEPKSEAPEVTLSEESKPEEQPTAETTETVPAPEIPVKKEEPLPVSDKLSDLIPEVPVVPELNTETLQETTSDVAVAN